MLENVTFIHDIFVRNMFTFLYLRINIIKKKKLIKLVKKRRRFILIICVIILDT